MRKDILDKFLGMYCKITTKDSNDEKIHTITGIISDFDPDDGSILIESKRGIFYLKVDTILSIKPTERMKGNK